MTFAVGVILFAVGIAISVALHECGHMWAAQATGMKVRRYFVGFGPKVFSWKRGETEYGLKALPLGGFCDIAGMTALDELEPDEVDRAMYRQKTWKRLFVMVSGIGMNFVLGFVLIMIAAMSFGLPAKTQPPATSLGALGCVADVRPDNGKPGDCTGKGPAQLAGLQQHDVVKSVNGVPVNTWDAFVAETQNHPDTVTYTVERNGVTQSIVVTPQQAKHLKLDSSKNPIKSDGRYVLHDAPTIGAAPDFNPDVKYTFLGAFPASADFTGHLFVGTVQSMGQIPSKVGSLWHAVTGGQRDPNTPMSVVGASRLGGETADRGLWNVFVLLLASLNFFLGAFNLVPLLPLDGGHMAVAGYEKIRNVFRRRRGLSDGAPVDYLRLMPATYVVVVIGGLYMLLTLTADIVNPITLPQ